jgi:hypothetical protein
VRFLGGFEPTLGLGWVVLELGAELLLALQRCLRLAAVELCCLSGGALVGELTLERRAVFPCAFFDPVGALGGGLGAPLGAGGALLGLLGELLASLGVLGERLGVACSHFGAARSLAGGLFCGSCLRGGCQGCLDGLVGLEPLAAGLVLGGA